jgi:hypothetical protein
MKVDRYITRLTPHPRRNLVRQRGIQAPFQLNQVLHAQLVFEIAADRFGVGCSDQVGAHGFNGALVGGYTQQHIQQAIGGARMAIHLQWQMLSQHGVRVLQHFSIGQFQSIMRHGLALLGLLGRATVLPGSGKPCLSS